MFESEGVILDPSILMFGGWEDTWGGGYLLATGSFPEGTLDESCM